MHTIRSRLFLLERGALGNLYLRNVFGWVQMAMRIFQISLFNIPSHDFYQSYSIVRSVRLRKLIIATESLALGAPSWFPYALSSLFAVILVIGWEVSSVALSTVFETLRTLPLVGLTGGFAFAVESVLGYGERFAPFMCLRSLGLRVLLGKVAGVVLVFLPASMAPHASWFWVEFLAGCVACAYVVGAALAIFPDCVASKALKSCALDYARLPHVRHLYCGLAGGAHDGRNLCRFRAQYLGAFDRLCRLRRGHGHHVPRFSPSFPGAVDQVRQSWAKECAE